MRSSPRWYVILCMAGALAGGCDDAPAPPQPAAQTPAASEGATTAPARPTTQQLLSGPKTRLILGTLPLSAEVPEGWTIRTAGPLVLLEGPTPSGQGEVQLAHRPSLKREQFEALLGGARKDQEQARGTGKTIDVRPLGTATILERRSVGRPLPADAEAEAGAGAAGDAAYNWTITVFVPQGGKPDDAVDVHELNIMGLTVSQYETDGPLLRPIVESLRLESASQGAG
jgi:hypothetical protein